ncbi:UNVERIFIED_CONTAM: protein phosphatase 2C family protein, partial [Bacteroidetes bacterium 56_B9]
MNEIMQAEGKKFRKQRPWHKTPPYVTARPEVTHRRINPETGEKLRFVVMATDGRKCSFRIGSCTAGT